MRSLDASNKGAARHPVGRISFPHPAGTDVQACLNLRAEQTFPALVAVAFPLSLLMWHGVRLHMGLGGQPQGQRQGSLRCTGRKARLEKVTACAPNSAT